MKQRAFSYQLEHWLESKGPKTLDGLIATFAEKSFAIIILILMFIPALPLPTGGVTHVFEIIVMFIALELIIGRRTIWLPKRWRKMRLGKTLLAKTFPAAIKRIRWLERFSRPRMGWLIKRSYSKRLIGVLFFILALAAFAAPPFSGLDTIPALGAALIALSLIFEDIIVFLAGAIIGAVGVGIIVSVAGLTIKLLHHLLG